MKNKTNNKRNKKKLLSRKKKTRKNIEIIEYHLREITNSPRTIRNHEPTTFTN